MNKTKTLTILTAAAMLTSIPALADTAESALVKGGALNLRQTPSLSAKVLGQFPTGTLVEIIRHGEDWHQVEVNGKVGYMMADYLTQAESPKGAVVHTNTGIGLNLREAPDTKAAILTSVKDGGHVTVLQKGKNWCRVAVDGVEGFMSTAYLKFDAQSALATGKLAIVTNPKDTQVLNLRQQPNLDAKVLDWYRNGVEVIVLKDQGEWFKVQVEDGQVGYMMSKFLHVTTETGTVRPFQAKLINVNGGSYVNFRKTASLQGKIIDRLPVGASVTVLEHGTDWCRVNADGVEGYISTWFLKW